MMSIGTDGKVRKMEVLHDVIRVFCSVEEANAHLSTGALCVPYVVETDAETLALVHESVVDVWTTCSLRASGFYAGNRVEGRNAIVRKQFTLEGEQFFRKVRLTSQRRADEFILRGLNYLAQDILFGLTLRGDYLWEGGKLVKEPATIQSLQSRDIRFPVCPSQKICG